MCLNAEANYFKLIISNTIKEIVHASILIFHFKYHYSGQLFISLLMSSESLIQGTLLCRYTNVYQQCLRGFPIVIVLYP